jgi:L-fuculose-phosphate aldolase
LGVFLQNHGQGGWTFSVSHEDALHADLIWVCRQLSEKGLVAATDGNVSCRCLDGSVLITPRGIPKGELQAGDLLRMDHQGRVLAGANQPSSEFRMHLAVYAQRPDVGAVVHAHPPVLTAFTLAGMAFVAEALPEVWLNIGPVPTAAYATPSTAEVVASIAPYLEHHQAILLERHGSLTLGKDLREAYLRLEKLEHASYSLMYSRMMSERLPDPLPAAALAKLTALRAGV